MSELCHVLCAFLEPILIANTRVRVHSYTAPCASNSALRSRRQRPTATTGNHKVNPRRQWPERRHDGATAWMAKAAGARTLTHAAAVRRKSCPTRALPCDAGPLQDAQRRFAAAPCASARRHVAGNAPHAQPAQRRARVRRTVRKYADGSWSNPHAVRAGRAARMSQCACSRSEKREEDGLLGVVRHAEHIRL